MGAGCFSQNNQGGNKKNLLNLNRLVLLEKEPVNSDFVAELTIEVRECTNISSVSFNEETLVEKFNIVVSSQATNIVTSERSINTSLLKLLEKAEQESKHTIIINEPQTKESNQRIIFKAIATAVLEFDSKGKYNKLKKIYFKWQKENLVQFRKQHDSYLKSLQSLTGPS